MMMSIPVLMLVLAPLGQLQAQTGEMCPGCRMGGGMWGGMLLVGLLVLAAVAALVALTVFLIRRSRPPRPPREV